MFGYIRILRSELRVREYEYYHAAYCGLCRSMGKCTGQCSRLTLSYDFAFLALVRMTLGNTAPAFAKRRCIAHPFRRRNMMERNGELDFCAHAAALLQYEKCRDDLADERGFRRLRAALRCMFLWGAYRRGRRKLPELAATVRRELERLRAIESERRKSVDLPAEVFGDLLAAIVSHGFDGTRSVLAANIGRQVGKFIYIADAADDLEKDVKSGAYNPFYLLYGAEFGEEQRESAEVAMVGNLAELEALFDLLDTAAHPDAAAILKNILYLGMPSTLKSVLYGKGKEAK